MVFSFVVKIFYLLSISKCVTSLCNLGRDSYNLTDWTGELHSPGYTSGSYPDNQLCTWTIRVSKGSRIRLTFTSFQLEDGALAGEKTACYDEVQIIEGGTELLKECGSQVNLPPIETRTNEVTVIFTTDEKSSNSGFRLEYTGICSMDIYQNSTIETPNYPNSPPDGVRCDWNINIPNDTAAVIQLNNQQNNLPSCNISPLVVTRKQGAQKTHKICLLESKSLLFKDVIFSYDPTDGNVPWNGTLKVEYLSSPQCEYLCVNADNCKIPRYVNGQGYRCICNDGYTGRNCDVKQEIVDPCFPKSCQNDGICVQLRGRMFTCNCPVNFTGEMCELPVVRCSPNFCLNGGICEDTPGKPDCDCLKDFTGDRCEIQINPCDSSQPPCQNQAKCIPSGIDYECICPPNLNGKNCENVIDPCFPNTCLNNGVCEKNDIEAPRCSCKAPFTGLRCDSLTDPCTGQECQNGGICTSNGASFKCTCAPGFTGLTCSVKVDLCTPQSCSNNGVCSTIDGGIQCKCSFGFTGPTCSVQEDFCTTESCLNNGGCSIVEGKVQCTCRDGFTGLKCEGVVDLCTPESCLNNGICSTTNSQIMCKCPNGFSGLRCEVELVEDLCLGKPCLNGGSCFIDGDSFSCNCLPTFAGKTCETSIAACQCVNGGICDVTSGKTVCTCPEGFKGENCEAIDICGSRPCFNGGNCREEGNSYKCTCPNGFSGPDCMNEIHPCALKPCKNGGTCLPNKMLFTCNCTKEFTGATCQTNLCKTIDCLDGEICSVADGGPKCFCPDGFGGASCKTKLNSCVSNPCQNGGLCLETSSGFRCECPLELTGETCADFNICQALCMNGATCVGDGDDVSCQCKDGFSGYMCDVIDNGCASSPCKYGRCVPDDVLGFKCVCDDEMTGRFCDIHKGQSHCTEDQDDIESSRIVWYATNTNSSNTQPCPENIIGMAERFCVEDSASPTGGRWTRPDLSFCVRPQFFRLIIKATLMIGFKNLSGNDLADISSKLVSITSTMANKDEEALYPGDLSVASNTINLIAEHLRRTESLVDTAITVAQDITKAMDSIIDPGTQQAWENARASLAFDSVKLLLNSSEAMAEYFDKPLRLNRNKRDTDGPYGYNFVGKNVEIQIVQMKNGGQTYSTNDSNSLTLPGSILDISSPFRDSVSVYNARFSSVANLLSMQEKRFGEQVREHHVVSEIMSSKVLGFPEGLFNDLKDPVIITFRVQGSSQSKTKNLCVFMNMTSVSEEYEWSGKGCTLHSYNDTHVNCHCSHLTNFALLLDVYGTSERLDKTNNAVLSYISYIGGSLSILGCLLAIIVFEYFRLKSDRIRIHEQLAVSIILVQIIFLIGVGRTSDKATTPVWACKTVAILLHYALTSLFCWMLVEGIHIYVVLVKVFKRGSHLKKYMALGWGAPLVIVGISFGVFYHQYGVGRICWLDRDMLLMCFVPTVGLVVITNAIILGIVIRVMVRSMNSTAKVNVQEISSLQISLKAAVILLPLLGLTWILAFLAVNADGTEGFAIAITYLFTIGNAFQGLIFFIFHCILNVDVRSAFERRYHKKKTMDTSSSRARKTSEADSLGVDSKGTITPKFVAVMDNSNKNGCGKPHFNPNIHFKDYDDEEDKMWHNVSLDETMLNNQFVLRLRPTEDDPVVSECITDIENYLGKPSRSSVHFSSTT